MPALSRTRRTFTVSFPSDLASQIGRLAKQESRTSSESFREAFRAYRTQQLCKTLDEINTLGRTDKHKRYTPKMWRVWCERFVPRRRRQETVASDDRRCRFRDIDLGN